MKQYKTFNDLEFKVPRPEWPGVQARMEFDNGYGVSVIQGPYAYTTGDKEYELAVFHGNMLCYDSGITDDVIGHIQADEVTRYMRLVQDLPAKP